MKYLSIILVLFIIAIISSSYTNGSFNSSDKRSDSFHSINKSCKPSTSKVRKLVKENWYSIKSIAEFTVSSRASFEVKNYGMDGDELVVDIYSKGYVYDISFSISFETSFDSNCKLTGTVTDAYNYKEH
ncbi:MAG: hypothetical protein V3V14_11495 [Saprospiraceae bacterium]